jgi:hypothetical protein
VLRLASFLCAALLAASCGRPHDLGVDTSSTSTSGSGGATTTTTSTTTSTTAGTGGMDAGPSGPTRLTIVNGVNDYDAVRFCFLPNDTPWPSAAGGLPFGRARVVDLATDLPADSDITAWVFTGNLAAAAGKTCTEILALAQDPDAGAPPVLAAPIGVIPKSVLASNKSMLLAPTGCMGGPGHDDQNGIYVCGAGYSSTTPTLGVALLAMSRITDPAKVTLQIVNAATMPASDVRILPGITEAKEVPVVAMLPQGAIGPTPPFTMLAAGEYGALDLAQIETFTPGGATATSKTTLQTARAASDVGTAGLVNGASLVLVAVGSQPGFAAGAFWHQLSFAVIEADPK